MKSELECSRCGRTYSIDEMVYRCAACDYPLEARYDYDEVAVRISKKLLKNREWNIW